jgi:protein involved in polysaccharide export with SLBB domain
MKRSTIARWLRARLWLLAGALPLLGCDTGGSPALSDETIDLAAVAPPLPPVVPGPYRIAYGDVLQVRFTYATNLDEQLPVRPDGKITLRMVGDVDVTGHTPAEVAQDLEARYASFVRHPDLVVIVTGFAPKEVYVGGEVARPGPVTTTGTLTALQAILHSGGFLDSAELANVVVLRDEGVETPGFMLLDLKGQLLMPGSANDIVLAPRDIVFVPKTRIAKLNQFIDEYVEDLIPISTGFSLSYNFGPTFIP